MKKVNKALKTFGNNLLSKGRYFLVKAFELNPRIITFNEMEDLVVQATGLKKDRIWGADSKYRVATLTQVKEILDYDLVDERKYQSEVNDCDDFADIIRARFKWIYGINSMAVARWIKIYKNGEYTGAHRANVFVAEEDGELKTFYLEPQTDAIQELKNNKVVRGSKEYHLNVVDF